MPRESSTRNARRGGRPTYRTPRSGSGNIHRPPPSPPPPPPPPPQRPTGQQQQGGGFGSAVAGAAVGSVIGSAVGAHLGGSKNGSGQEGTATAGEANQDQFYGRCADKFESLVACAEYFGGNIDRCNKEFDELTSCRGGANP